MLIAESCVAVIPCLNEEATIVTLVRELRSYLPRSIVVDDGSTDHTAQAAAAAGAEVIANPRSSGKGAALDCGFRRARELGFQWALSLDGDGQHLTADTPKFLEAAERSGARMVVGNRMGQARRIPALRRWTNRWMSARLSKYCGKELPDSQCGFRLVHLESWGRFDFKARYFEIESELLVRFVGAGLKVEFVPVAAHYAQEQSKIDPFSDTVRWFRWWAAIHRELSEAPAGPGLNERVGSPFLR